MSESKIDDITNTLRRRILSGEFGTGGRLPSLRMFAEQYETSRETINKVLQRLQAEGLVSSLGPQGVFVNALQARLPGHTLRFAPYLEELGSHAVDALLGTAVVVDASSDVARFLGVHEGAPVVRLLRRQGTVTVHYRIIETFYSVDLISDSILEKVKEDGNFDVISAIKQEYGKAINFVRDDIIARFPTQDEQELLRIVRNAPVLEVNSVSYADDRTVALVYHRSVLVANYFVFSYGYAPPAF